MKSFNFYIGVLIQIIMLVVFGQMVAAQDSSGSGLSSALFELREMDMHIHAGKEREIPLDQWIDLSVKDGRKVMVLLAIRAKRNLSRNRR